MSKIIVNAEVASVLVKNLSLFKTDTNKVRLAIGLKDLGDGLACKATIVNGGNQGEFGFKVSLPKGETFTPGEDGKPMLSVVVSAKQFVTYLSALCSDGADVIMAEVDGKTMSVSVPNLAKFPLGTFTESEAEPLISIGKSTSAKMQFGKDFLSAISRGAYLATNDDTEVTNRSAFYVDAEVCNIFSNNKASVVKAWCKPTAYAQEDGARAFSYLSEKMASSNAEGKALISKKVQELQAAGDISSLIAFAESEGFDKASPLAFSLPAAATNIITKMFDDTVSVMVSSRHMCIRNGYAAAIFTLAGAVPGIYKQVSGWENEVADSRVVIDRDKLLKSLSLVKLNEQKTPTPVHVTFTAKNGVTLTKDGIVAYVPVAKENREGDCKYNDFFNANVLSAGIGRLAAGNVVVYRYGNGGTVGSCYQFSSGDLNGATSSRLYVLKVKGAVTAAPVEEADESDVKAEVKEEPVIKEESAKVAEPAAEETKVVPEVAEEKKEVAVSVASAEEADVSKAEEKKPMTMEEKKAAADALKAAFMQSHTPEQLKAFGERMAAHKAGQSVTFTEDEMEYLMKLKEIKAA